MKMTVFKYRMAAKRFASLDCGSTVASLIVLLPTLVVSTIGFGESLLALHDATFVILLISTIHSVISFCFAVALLKSTISRYPQQHVCSVTAWMINKIVQLPIGAIFAILFIVWIFQKSQSLITTAILVLGLYPLAIIGCMPLYFVNKYRIELRSYVNEDNDGVEDALQTI